MHLNKCRWRMLNCDIYSSECDYRMLHSLVSHRMSNQQDDSQAIRRVYIHMKVTFTLDLTHIALSHVQLFFKQPVCII